ncbi:MAG TPA: PQQ-binding-like beta-propeller repeat protein, partial [Solirubrobacterales bacterium]|nr:PQQ-binding-like beta-propeller repeat protein [Solirubrobacterales bacterium]
DTPVQGQVYAQPLVDGEVAFVATEDDWIYGIDRRSGAVLWERNVGVPWNPADLSCGDLVPHIGITGTPVIDPATGVAYFYAKSYASGTSGPAVWKMHAVDVETGAEEPGFPVEISGEAENLPGVSFGATHQLQRPGLLLMNGVVYAGFGSHCDSLPYQGWIVGVSTSGVKKAMWATAEEGGAVWQAGGGLASDGEGQILFSTGNSFGPQPSPTPTPPADLGEAVVRLGVQPGGGLEATDFFEPWNRQALDEGDLDLGSGAPLALPSQYFGTPSFPHLVVEAGKQHLVYLLDRDHLGGFGQGPEGKNADLQEVAITHGVFGSPSVWPGDGGYVYLPTNGSLEVLEYSVNPSGEPRLAKVAESPQSIRFGSGSPTVTSNGTTAGSAIAWIVSRCAKPTECGASTLNAYAAVPSGATANLLWSADVGTPVKFSRPAAGGGRVYVGTAGHLLAFGATHHMLTASVPGGNGWVSSDVPGIECDTTCSHEFADGEKVTLIAIPNEGYEFTGWNGGGCGEEPACEVTMYEDASVSAEFTHPGAPGITGPPGGGTTGPAGGTGPTPPTPAEPATPLPETKLLGAVISHRNGSALFRFTGTDATRFRCRLIRPPAPSGLVPKRSFTSCRSPRLYRHLAPGRYVFEVRAVNEAGQDPQAARRRFSI